MSFFDRLKGKKPADPPPPPDPLAELDVVIAELESCRAQAVAVLREATAGDRTRLADAMKVLDQKLDQAVAKRKDLGERLARIDHRKKLADEIKSLGAELQALPDDETSSARRAEIRARFAEIKAEAAAS